MMTEDERNELLIRMDVKLDELKNDFDNHLKTHAKYTYLALTTALGMIISLILVLMNK